MVHFCVFATFAFSLLPSYANAVRWPGTTVSQKLALLQASFPGDELARIEQFCKEEAHQRQAQLDAEKANLPKYDKAYLYALVSEEKRQRMREAEAFFERMRRQYDASGYEQIRQAFVAPLEMCAEASADLLQHWECVLGGLLKLEALIVHGQKSPELAAMDADQLLDRLDAAVGASRNAFRGLQLGDAERATPEVRSAVVQLRILSLHSLMRAHHKQDNRDNAEEGAEEGEEWSDIDLD